MDIAAIGRYCRKLAFSPSLIGVVTEYSIRAGVRSEIR
jgi:hypothetical protein